MHRSWFIAPIVSVDEGEDSDGNWVVGYNGPGSSGAPYHPPRMVCRAYRPTDVLVGLPLSVPAPTDWVSQTVDEAVSHFTSVMGRAPNPGEVE